MTHKFFGRRGLIKVIFRSFYGLTAISFIALDKYIPPCSRIELVILFRSMMVMAQSSVIFPSHNFMQKSSEAVGSNDITSRLITFAGAKGLQIVAYIDEGPESRWNERFVVLAPRYGETKKNNLQLAYTLAANGFKVLRFDHTNHIGESDGTMDQFTLSGAASDILKAVGYVDAFFEPSEIVLVTLSLSCRSGLRACATDSRISRFISVVGMVDMDSTLQAIYKRDFFGELTVGADWRYVDILGFEIDGKHFHDDLLESNMKSLQGSIVDASGLTIPILHLSAENDLWVKQEDVDQVYTKCASASIRTIPAVGHEINENNEAVMFAFSEIIRFSAEGLERADSQKIQSPNKKMLVQQNKLERGRLQEIVKFTDSENEFWGDYLGKFGIIEDAHYYAEYFKDISTHLGAIKSGDTILDAGCGNGFFGISVLHSILKEKTLGKELPHPVHYAAIELTTEGLKRSYERQIGEVSREMMSNALPSTALAYSYRKLDFDVSLPNKSARLPYADNSINKLCCSLVISYLKDPALLMSEFYRILAPDGVGIISSMKPGCDMTVLYHSYVDQDEPDDQNDKDANRLLSAAGKIKLKKDSGVYNFFSETELERMAYKAGFKELRSSRSLGNQANVVRVVK